MFLHIKLRVKCIEFSSSLSSSTFLSLYIHAQVTVDHSGQSFLYNYDPLWKMGKVQLHEHNTLLAFVCTSVDEDVC